MIMITPSYPDGMNIEVATANGRTDEEAVANARLIAAAPEMYELIKELSKIDITPSAFLSFFDDEYNDLVDKLDELIMKADDILRCIEGKEGTE